MPYKYSSVCHKQIINNNILKMKKIFYTLIITFLLTVSSFGQNNNPYNQKGKDMATTLEIIVNDFKAGKIKEINQETLDHYTTTTPIKTIVTLESVTEIASQLSGQDPENTLKSLPLSDFSKNILLKAGAPQADIIKLVDDVNSSKLKADEKEFLLTTLAFTYNKANNDGFWSGLVGAGIGYLICNVPCCIIGGVLGAVFGEIGK